jgi:tRNA threonylcarbamoyladenosine biosynthesis protein TsaE
MLQLMHEIPPDRRMTTDHPEILGTRQLAWPTEADCARDAARMAACPALREALVELHGPLGAGKTTFVRHLLRALGVTGHVRSPTYALLETYRPDDGAPVAHLDFYRFGDPREWDDAGLREVFAGPGLKLVEWPQQAQGRLPRPDLRILIEPDPPGQARTVRLEALSERGRELLA